MFALVAIGAGVTLSLLGRTADGPRATSQTGSAPFLQQTEMELLRQALTPVPCPTTALDPGILATPLRKVDLDTLDAGIQAPTPANPDQFAMRSNADNRCFASEFVP
ncbi:MAG TPA: hypothetical protein VFS30_15230 [Dehalococcoidia bacterium]|nr:hypothetical protein [Dehalococcoidia bacterium]